MENKDIKTDIAWIKKALEEFKDEWDNLHKTLGKLNDILKDHENKLKNHEQKFEDFEEYKKRSQRFWEKMILGLSVGTAVAIVSYILTLI